MIGHNVLRYMLVCSEALTGGGGYTLGIISGEPDNGSGMRFELSFTVHTYTLVPVYHSKTTSEL